MGVIRFKYNAMGSIDSLGHFFRNSRRELYGEVAVKF